MIKAGIFDVGGVLHDNSMDNATADTAAAFGISVEKLQETWLGPLGEMNVGKIDEKEFWNIVLEKLGREKLPRTDLLTREFINHINLHRDTIALVNKLKQEGLKLGVVSNTIKPHADYARSIGLYQPFDVLVLSYEAGVAKPNPKIWHYALEKLAVKPEESFFTDDIPAYVEAARNLGINAFHYEGAVKLAEDIKKLGVNLS